MAFDPKRYESEFIKPLRRNTKLPPDLWARYAIEDSMRSDADIAAQLKAVRMYWNTGAGKQAMQFICKLCKQEDEKLAQANPDMGKRAFWDKQRQARSEQEKGEISTFADELKREFGAFGVITTPVLEDRAKAFAATDSQMFAAAQQAGLDVRAPAILPSAPPIAVAQYNSLNEALALADAASVAGLLYPGVTGVTLLAGFRSSDASQRLDQAAVQRVKDESEKVGKSSKNDATKEAVGILLKAIESKVDLAQIDLYRAVQSLGLRRGAPLSVRVKVLTETGLQKAEAAHIALSASGVVRDDTARVRELLEAGELREARRAVASLDENDLKSLQPLVEQAEQQVAKLRADAAVAVAARDEARAIELLEQAVRLAVDDEALDLELKRSPLPPPANLRVDADGAKVSVYWDAGQRHTNATRYMVRRKATASVDVRDGDKVFEGDATKAVDDSAPVARQLFYSVFAVNHAGIASRPTTASITVLPPPYGLVSEVGADWVSLTWQNRVAAEGVRAYRMVDSRQVELTATGNTIRLPGLREGEPVPITLVARYRGSDGSIVESASVTTTLTPRGAAKPVLTLQLVNIESQSGCRVRVGWQPVDHSQVTVRYTDSPAPWEPGSAVTPEQMASYGVEASGALVTQGLRIGFETAVPEGIVYFTPFSRGGTGIVVGKSRGIGTSAPVAKLAAERFDGAVNVTWVWPGTARVAQVALTQGGNTRAQIVDKDRYQSHGCRVVAGAGPLHIEVRAAIPVDGELSLSSPLALDLEGEAARVSYSVVFKRRGPGRLTLKALDSATNLGVVLVAQPGKVVPFSKEVGTPLLTETVALEPRRERTIEFEVPDWLRKPFCVKVFVVSGSAVLQHPPSAELKVD